MVTLENRVEISIKKLINRYCFPKDATIRELQLHGFCDTSEDPFAGVVYIQMTDSEDKVHTSLVLTKTKVAPIKRLTIPHLELCGTYLLTKILHHVREVLKISSSRVFAWTDSTIVLDWLKGNPRRFKQFVGNRISIMMDLLPPERCRHVNKVENPADCAPQGIFPTELENHNIWWSGPKWLHWPSSGWPKQHQIPAVSFINDCVEEVCCRSSIQTELPIIPLDQYSDYHHLKQITAWVI